MFIKLLDSNKKTISQGEVDPARLPPYLTDELNNKNEKIPLIWENVMDDHNFIQRCPICGCKELFRRKDLNQKWGLTIIIVSALCSMVLFAMHYVFAAILILFLVFIIDAAIYFIVPECIVCYKCRSEFRKIKISKKVHNLWDLSIGEKYRSE